MFIIFAIPFLAFSIYFGWSAFQSIKEAMYLKNNGILTTGNVEKVEEFEDTDSNGNKIIRYRLFVRFDTSNGLEIKGKSTTSERYYHAGLAVHILYDPNDTNNFSVNDPESGEEIGAGICGLLFAIVFGSGSLWLVYNMTFR